MNRLPDNLYSAAQSRELDRIASADFGIPSYALMQRAGQAAFELLQSRWPRAQRILVIAGPGNNGGDGYIVGRLALIAGLEAGVSQVGDVQRIRGDAARARSDYLKAGGHERCYDKGDLGEWDVIVDALFGTGLEREVRDSFLDVIVAINHHPAPVLAVDIPSGLHSDRGVPLGDAVSANATLTFIALKMGLLTGLAPEYRGTLHYADLGVPAAAFTRLEPSARRIAAHHYRHLLARRPRASHKGHYGHVLVIGGAKGTYGAARMAGEAAARTGAGLVSIATDPDNAPVLNATCPVLMVHGVETAQDLAPLARKATVIAIGPGLGVSARAQELLEAVINLPVPLVLDADALNLLSAKHHKRDNWILTPHPGEAARLLKCDSRRVQSDRWGAARDLQALYGGVIVLKGAGTIVQSKQVASVCMEGNPGMASGGMGDVLTGVIAGLLTQGADLVSGAELGVCLHAEAGDLAAQDGERGLMATDLFPHLRRLVNPL